jgi:hypothetical protein
MELAMIEVKTYERCGLTPEEVELCVRCEALAVKLIEAGFPVERINDELLNFLLDPGKRRPLAWVN